MKIFELLINDDDDLSGVEFLSLVKNPATEISWEVFNSDEPQDCDNCKVEGYDFADEELGVLDNLGTIPNGDIFLSGEFSDADIELTPHDFVSVPAITSNPNQLSFGDDPEGSVITRFFYAVDTTYGAPLIKTSRALCRKVILAQRVYSLTDLKNLSQQLTSAGDTYKLVMRARINSQVDFHTYKAGKYCRHLWKRVDFPIGINGNFEEVLKKIPSKVQPAIAKGTQVAMVGRPYVSEMSLFPPARGAGRNEFSKKDSSEPIAFHMGLFLYENRFAAMLAEPTAKIITKVKLCYYGQPGDIYPIVPEGQCFEGYAPVDVYSEYFEGTGDVLEKFKVRHNFAQVPSYIQETAQRAVDWAEENGWGDCGTDVGKQRAHDLARKGQEHSLETLTRMYSYGARHKVDFESSKSFEDGCGLLMMACWGFTPSNYDQAMEFLKREINKSTDMNVAFSKDEMKGDITAVVFQPNQKIYRYDKDTDKPYFVFMSKETIRKMLMKFSKVKQGKGGVVNLEHSGMIFSPDDVYTYENWLVGEDPEKDKSYEIFGRTFEAGTWMTTIHFKDKRMFEEFVLSNKTQGISLEGAFQEIPFNFFEIKSEDFVVPKAGEEENEFMNRCVSSDTMMNEYDTEKQRIAVCYSSWNKKSFKVGVPHYTADGKLWTGDTHKDADGRLMTGKVHSEDSEYLYHQGEYAEVGPRGGIKDSPKAPASKTPNKDPKNSGSAKGDASNTRGAIVDKQTEETLQKKSDDWNERYKEKRGYGTSVGMLKSVYQRGLGAYNTSHSPVVKSAKIWAMARVNAFLLLMQRGTPSNPRYKTDNDLLPAKHPKSQKMEVNTDSMIDYKKPNETEEFAPYAWDDCIRDMTERYGNTAAPRICGKIRSENMAQMGTYDGAPYYPYWEQAQEASVSLGCSDYHLREEYGFFPCKTHTEAKKLYQDYNILQLLDMVLDDLGED